MLNRVNEADFARLVAEEYPRAVPERFLPLVKNCAVLVADEPDEETLAEMGLPLGDTLLGLYRGQPLSERGADYGVSGTLPDTVTIYRLPVLDEAEDFGGGEAEVRRVIRETIWHEIAHHFGLDEDEVMRMEEEKGWR
jgi:predicted Zn-dependent protease with MMP-like domain